MFIKFKKIMIFIMILIFFYGAYSYIQFMKEEHYVIVFENHKSRSITKDKQIDKYRDTISKYGLTITNQSNSEAVFEVKSSLKTAENFKNDYRDIIKSMSNRKVYYNLESINGVICPDGLEIARDYNKCKYNYNYNF